MPGPVSERSIGPGEDTPYVPSWCYPRGPKTCPCGHHEGYHDDAGACLLAATCRCAGLRPQSPCPYHACPSPVQCGQQETCRATTEPAP